MAVRRVALAALLVGLALATVASVQSAPSPPPPPYKPPSDEDLQKICAHSLQWGDPKCQNGGRLHANNSTAPEPERYNNCVQCDCPDGWAGIDCSLCKSKEICPLWTDPDTGNRVAATGCSWDQLLPTAFEAAHEKHLTCECSGADGDRSTAWACNQQPFTHWDATVTYPNGTDKPATLKLIERAGMISQDEHPGNCPGPGGTQVPCPTPQRYKYAYAVVWEGTFDGCRWATGDCISPLKGENCVTLRCEDSSVVCPPNWVERCPGWTRTSCGKVPGEGSAKYWSHRCNPLAVPSNGTAVKLACEPTPANDTRKFQCYISQEGSFMASLGMKCTSGSCLYEPDGPAPPAPVPHEHKTNLEELLVVGAIGCAIASVVVVAVLLIAADKQQSAAQVSHWSKSAVDPVLGEAVAALQPAAATPHAPVVLAWSRISCSVPKGQRGKRKRVLRGVSGVSGVPAAGGRAASCMTAILGPSGAGKTTLLDVLSGRRTGRGVAGVICLNGHRASPAQVRALVGYVPQDDILPGTSTVWEFLSFHAALRLPALDAAAQSARVWQVIEQLGLEKVAHSFIGDAWVRGLSGGERRRVSIAAELLTAPGLLFCDEVTTGLDSSNAAKVVDILAGLAAGGVGVVLTIHQPRPDVFRLMHRVLLLSCRGQVVYAGAVADAEAHFAALGYMPPSADISVADHMLDVVIKSPAAEVEQLVAEFQGSRAAADDLAWAASLQSAPWPLPPARPPPPLKAQLLQLSGRLLRRAYRHPFLIALNFVAAAVTAAGLGITFYSTGFETGGIQSRLGCLFFILLYLSMMALGSLPVWRQEGLLFYRERESGVYGTNAYFLATVAFDLVPLRVAPPAFFALFSYWAIGLHAGCATCVLAFLLILVWANIAAATMAMMIGAAAPSDAAANTAGSLAIMASLLFGGFMLNKDQVPGAASWAAAASYFNYAYEALAINEFHRAPTPFFFTSPLNSTVLPTLRVSGEGVLKEFGFQAHRFWGDVLAVIACGLVFGGMTYLLLLVSGGAFREALASLSLRRRSAGVRSGFLFERLVSIQSDDGRASAFASPRSTAGLEEQLLPMTSGDAGGTDGADAEDATAEEDDYDDGEEGLDSGSAAAATGVAANGGSAGGVSGSGVGGGGDEEAGLAEAGGWVGDEQRPLLPPSADMMCQQATQGEAEAAAAVLSWEDICCAVRVGGARQLRQILTDVSGIAGAPRSADTTASSGTNGTSGSAGGINSNDKFVNRSHSGSGRQKDSSTGSTGGGMCAILGPSGAGKTTLLDILAGRRNERGVSGDIRLSGRRVSPDEVRAAAGYVPQDDILPGTSTVWEFLCFHAALRLPGGGADGAAHARVKSLLRQLSLAKVAHSFIGDEWVRGLSGGERRRVSIAAELITAPRLMFLDEPTTGLDSTNAAAVVDILAGLAAGGVTVVLSVHQPRPDVLAMMQRCLILSSFGRVVYSGPMDRARQHFSSLGHDVPQHVNIADAVLDLVIRSPPSHMDKLVAGFAASPVAAADAKALARLTLDGAMCEAQGAPVALARKYQASFRDQLRALSGRQAANARRHPGLIAVNWGATLVVAIGLGAVYSNLARDSGGIQNRLGSLAFMVLYLGVTGLSSLPIWRAERLLFIRERASGVYGTTAYFAATVAWDFLPMRVAPTTLFAGVTYWVMGLRPGAGRLLSFLGVLVLTNLAGTAMSMAVGAASPSTAVANSAGGLAVLLAALFGGFLMSRAQMPALTRWLSSLSFVRYGYEALLDNEFHGAGDFYFTPYAQKGIPKEKIPSVRVSGDIVLGTFGFEPGAFWADVWWLLVLLAAFLAATFLLLKFRRQP